MINLSFSQLYQSYDKIGKFNGWIDLLDVQLGPPNGQLGPLDCVS